MGTKTAHRTTLSAYHSLWTQLLEIFLLPKCIITGIYLYSVRFGCVDLLDQIAPRPHSFSMRSEEISKWPDIMVGIHQQQPCYFIPSHTIQASSSNCTPKNLLLLPHLFLAHFFFLSPSTINCMRIKNPSHLKLIMQQQTRSIRVVRVPYLCM